MSSDTPTPPGTGSPQPPAPTNRDILPIPAIPAALREAAARSALIPFVGAGASRLAGCPGWSDFADGALRWFVTQGKFSYSQFEQIRHLTPRLKLSVARALAEANSLKIDYKSLLHPTSPKEHKKGRRLYRSLSALSTTFVTTNYDEWLDEEIAEPSGPTIPESDRASSAPVLRRTVIYKVPDLTPAVLTRKNTVIHLHGSLQDPDSLILTTQDYIGHYLNDRFGTDPRQENRVLTFLSHLFDQATVLFVGYGLEELEILEYVVRKGRDRPRLKQPGEARHYVLQGFFSHETQVCDALRSYYLRECGIQLIPFSRDERDHDQLIEVLEAFAREMPAGPPMILEQARQMEALLGD